MISIKSVSLKFIIIWVFIFLTSGCSLMNPKIPNGRILNQTERNHYKSINGINYHYEEYNTEGKVVFLLHGFGSSTYTWVNVIPHLVEQGYHVYALDMKGFGWSDKPKDTNYHPFVLADEVNTFLEEMGLRNVIFVGNSLGGAVATHIALEHPEKIDKMILLDAAGYPMKFPFVIKLARLPGSSQFSKMIFGRWMVKWNLHEVYHNNGRLTDKNIDEYYVRLCTENAVGAMISMTKAFDFNQLEDFVNEIPNIKHQTLIIHGENDKWIPIENSHNYRRDLENSVFYKISSCGHVPQEEYPDLTSKLIIDFIKGNKIEETPLN